MRPDRLDPIRQRMTKERRARRLVKRAIRRCARCKAPEAFRVRRCQRVVGSLECGMMQAGTRKVLS